MRLQSRKGYDVATSEQEVTEKAQMAQEVLGGSLKHMTPNSQPPRQMYNVPGIIRAKLAVMAEVRGVRKDRKNQHQGYLFTDHDDVTEALQEAFVKYGISQRVSVVHHERSMDGQLLTIEVHVSWTSLEDGTTESVMTWGESTVKNKNGRPDSVEFGQALSYAVKCAQLKNFMLVGGLENADPEESHGRQEEPARREEPRSEPRREEPKKQAKGVDDSEVNRWAAQYEKIATRKELDEQRKKLEVVSKLLTDDQYERLGEADRRAAERVTDEVKLP